MLKSQCEELYARMEPVILESLTRTRTADNLNQYLFLDYQYYKGLMIDEKISNKHFSVALTSPKRLKAYILNPDRNLLCVNDVHLSEERYEALREAMISAMEIKFQKKSRFER